MKDRHHNLKRAGFKQDAPPTKSFEDDMHRIAW